MSSKIAPVYRTTNYDRFRRLDGNRDVTKARAKRIAKSICEVGYIFNPIICNEKMEIIDGQGRFEALKELNYPIDYVVVDGAGLKECIAMNNSTSRWTVLDYVASGAERVWEHQEDYQYLQGLMKAFKNSMPIEPIVYAADTFHRSNNVIIQNGLFRCDRKAYEQATVILEQLARIFPAFREVKGHRERYATAVCFMLRSDSVDGERLHDQIWKYREQLRAVSGRQEALEILENIYNYRSRQKIYLMSEFKKECEVKA